MLAEASDKSIIVDRLNSYLNNTMFKISENLLVFPVLELHYYNVVMIILILLVLLKCCLFRSPKLRRRPFKPTLGTKPLSEIGYLKDIIKEIHFASCHCNENYSLISRCVTLLQMYPAACNIPMNGHGYTPFLRACWNGCPELISYMIDIGANLKSTTDTGENAVYLATYFTVKNNVKRFQALQILLDAGAEINLPRHDGFTALHLAAAKGHTRLVRWLLAHGADAEPEGVTSPAQIAISCGHTKAASFLQLST